MSAPVEIRPFYLEAQKKGELVVTDSPRFELENYIANYNGRTKVRRLIHIGRTSAILGPEAIQQAVTEASTGKDVGLYNRATEVLSKVFAPEDESAKRSRDQWAEDKNREISAETAHLEAELKGYKNNLIKESIRIGHAELGAHYQAIGDYHEAVKSFSREREFCQTHAHIENMVKKLMVVSIEQENWLGVENNANKLRNSAATGAGALSSGGTDSAKAASIRDASIAKAAIGLAEMSGRKYADAARTFLACDGAMAQWAPDAPETKALCSFMTPSDIAAYGALCALATIDRGQIRRQVLENHGANRTTAPGAGGTGGVGSSSKTAGGKKGAGLANAPAIGSGGEGSTGNTGFRAFLDLEPHLRRLVSYFATGKFAAALAVLDAYRADMLLDVHLAPHFPWLYERIRRKALVHYLKPFSRIEISAVAEAFAKGGKEAVEEEKRGRAAKEGESGAASARKLRQADADSDDDDNTAAKATPEEVSAMQALLVALVHDGHLPHFRLDLERGLLVASRPDARRGAHARAIESARDFERAARAKALRMEAVLGGAEVRGPAKGGSGGAGGAFPPGQQGQGMRTVGEQERMQKWKRKAAAAALAKQGEMSQ